MRRLTSARAVAVAWRSRASLLLVPTLLAVLVGMLAPSAAPSDPVQALTFEYYPFGQIDPQRISDGEDIAGQNLLEGLVTSNAAETGVLPATADRWTISQGGTVYTFHIRDAAAWSDGTRVTAQDFEWTYKRLLTPSTSALDKLNGGSSYPENLGIAHALDFQLGKVSDWVKVGVKALDASHLRITLASPNPGFLQEMALPAMVALPEKNLTSFPFDWQTAAHWVGNGPFTIDSWTPNSRMVLVRNEHYWDAKDVHLDRVTISLGTPTDAQIRKLYTTGALDVARITAPAGLPRDALATLPQDFVRFLTLIPSLNPALEDLRAREAIALAIPRAEVANAAPLFKPATSLVPSTLPGFDRSVGLQENVAAARKLLAAAGYPGGKGFPTFIVMTTDDDPIIRATVRALRRNLGIRAVQDVENPGVENAKRHEVQPATRVGYFSTGYGTLSTWRDWVYKYPPSQTELLSLTPSDYTHYQVLQAAGTAKSLDKATSFLAAHASAQSKRFAALAAAADATVNPERATVLYKEAAAARQATYEFIPLAYGDAIYVVRPGIHGVHIWPGYEAISFKSVSVG
jgi:oligopeptide transport system substrate-binding protein